jgi:outer membrane murein-binding lipoprotein Lpp
MAHVVRTSISFSLAALVAVVALAGCASGPTKSDPQTAAAMSSCSQLNAEIARTEAARRAAQEKKETAWKGVVPFVVVERYGSGKAGMQQADRRLVELQSEFIKRGCVRES